MTFSGDHVHYEWFDLLPKLNELSKYTIKSMLPFYVILLTKKKLSLSNVV